MSENHKTVADEVLEAAERPIDPIIEIRQRLDKFAKELAELRRTVANRVMVEPQRTSLTARIEPANARLI